MEMVLLCIPFEKTEMKSTMPSRSGAEKENWLVHRIWDIVRDHDAVQNARAQVQEMEEEALEKMTSFLRLFAPSRDIRRALKKLGISGNKVPVFEREEVPSDIHLPNLPPFVEENGSLDFLVSCCLQQIRGCSPTCPEWQGTQRLVCILLEKHFKPSWQFLEEHNGEVLDPQCCGVSVLGVTLPQIGFSSKFAQQVAEWQSNEQALERLETLLRRDMDSECKSELIRSMSQSLRNQCNNVKNESDVWLLPSKTLHCGLDGD
jgi:hypothetical protein